MNTPTLYLPRDSGLHRLHPFSKLAIILFFLAAAAVLPNPWTVAGLFFLGLLPLALWGQVASSFLRGTFLILWPFALSLFILQGFFAPGEQILLEIGPFHLTLEGILAAFEYTARILVWLGGGILLMLATRPDLLMQALIDNGLPFQIAYIVLASMQIIPRFQSKAQVILDAQQSRGLETKGSLLHRLRMLFPLVAPLILGSILDVEERAIALEARAFNRKNRKTSLNELHDTRGQRLARRGVLLATIAVLLSAIGMRFLR